MSYTKEQEDFLDEMYQDDSPVFGEPELALTSGDRMILGLDNGEAITIEEVDALFAKQDKEVELGRELNYKEISQGY